MQEFKQTFINEATELLEKLEHNLLIFEKKTDDTSLLESILRTMHTLKGSGSMFGYDKIVEITHKTENIYTKIQEGEISVSEKVINISFSVADLVRKLLEDNVDNTITKKYNKVLGEINDFFTEDELEAEHQEATNTGLNLYYINFEPDNDIEDRGVNLTSIFSQLSKIGKSLIIPKNIEDEEKYSVCWEIFVATENNIDNIEEIMMFVDLECEVTHISEQNLLLNKDFINLINENIDTKIIRTPEQIIELVELIAPNTAHEDEETGREIEEIAKHQNPTIRVDSVKLDDLMNRLSALITLKSEIKLTATLKGYNEISELADKLDEIINQLKTDVFEMRLVALDTVRINLERLIRDTSIQLKKEVQFTHEGLNTELDKTIVDKLSAPLLHIIRNSIDHGIENTEIRAERNKTAHGNIKMKAFRSNSHVYIQIIDDGGGIDQEKVLQKAIIKGFIKQGTKLSEQEIYDLILKSGFTTTDSISNVSGRGVGLDVVKTEISKLRGDIEIESTPTKGTTITLKLPLSLSIVDTLLVKTQQMYFSIPLEEIDKCELSTKEDIKKYDNNYIDIDNQLVPYIALREVFKQDNNYNKTQRAIIIKKANTKTAIIVDKIIGEFQSVVKPLGKAFEDRKFLSGGSILADGNIAYLIDTQKL